MPSLNTSTTGSTVRASVLLNRLLARTRLRQLHLLVLIADLGSIQRAAAEAGLTQPSATKAVAELERLVGQPLFERHARGVRPTFACRDLLPLLRSMLSALNGCAETLAAAAEGAQGVISVGAITGGITGLLGRALPAFLVRHPQLRVELVEDSRHVLLSRFAERTLDLVLVREPSALASGARFVPLLADRIVAVAAPGHPLLRRRELRPDQLLDHTWVMPPLDAAMHGVFERLFEPCGRLPARTPLITRSLPMTLEFLRAQPALVLTPYSFVQTFVEAGLLQVLKLRCDDTLPPIGMLMPEAPSKRGVMLLSEFLTGGRLS
jgi:DNA-binding transcriptional LysR family regulator